MANQYCFCGKSYIKVPGAPELLAFDHVVSSWELHDPLSEHGIQTSSLQLLPLLTHS